MDLYAELQAILRELDTGGVEYAICGAMALAIHGVPRATQDIDMLVRSENIDAFRRVARRCGFAIEALPMTFSSSGITVHRFTKLGGARPVVLDALVADGPLQAVWDTRVSLPLDQGTAWVVSRDGLVTLKTTAGRPQDLTDVKRLLELDSGGTDGGRDDG